MAGSEAVAINLRVGEFDIGCLHQLHGIIIAQLALSDFTTTGNWF
ncbi:MAG: hypothetical protein ACFHHU_13465 [Porticoccaceae bacterium]